MHLGDLLKTVDIKKAVKKETAKDVIDKLFEGVKKEQPNVTYMSVMSKLLAVKNNKDVLDWFYSECTDYKNRNGSFAKRFWGGFKEFSTEKKFD